MTSSTNDQAPALAYAGNLAAAWRSSEFAADITPGLLGATYSTAARIIETRGYNSHYHNPVTGDPVSMAAALELAARAIRPGDRQDAADLEEEAAAHLAGMLYMTGQRRTRVPGGAYGSGSDMSDIPRAWDDDNGRQLGAQAPGESLPVILLRAAAAFMHAMAPRG